MPPKVYELKMYADLARIAKAMESIATSLGRLAQPCDGEVWEKTACRPCKFVLGHDGMCQ